MSHRPDPFIGVCGDVHGHLQLALCAWALEQQRSGRRLDAILLCGDVGTFTDSCPLDSATRRHASENPCELEFRQWSREPVAPWLDGIFAPPADGGLGLDAPVIMVHGNHEGFEHLEPMAIECDAIPAEPVAASDLPAVDARGRIRYLPSGWRVRTASGVVVGGVCGIQPGQRLRSGYHEMAYIDPTAVDALRVARELDIIVTHQGPARVQGEAKGSVLLDRILDRAQPALWFHGHSRVEKSPVTVNTTTVVPLGDATFDKSADWRIAADAWCEVGRSDDALGVVSRRPAATNELGRARWIRTAGHELVAPHLATWIPAAERVRAGSRAGI